MVVQERTMKIQKVAGYVAVLCLGGVIGYSAHGYINREGAAKVRYVERREGQYNHINPLLACDAAEDVLNGPEIASFKSKIENYISTRIDKRWFTRVSVYFRELNDGTWFSIGDMEKFIPASLRKVPLMIALLKQAERSPSFLDRKLTYDFANDYTANQNVKPSHTLVKGVGYTVRDLIYRMIVYSDNNAFMFLTKQVDPAELDKVYAAVNFPNPNAGSDADYLTVQTYESFFRVLYNASYLNRSSSDWALEILTKSEFKAGLVSGVPANIPVAHKFGEHSEPDKGTVQLHDCGIVYYPKHPYLLCVMSQGPDFEFLDDVIVAVSHQVFQEVDAQAAKKTQ